MVRTSVIILLGVMLTLAFNLDVMPEWNEAPRVGDSYWVSSSHNSSNSSGPSFSSEAVSYSTVNGEYVLCSPGCSDCSTGICGGCLTGYALKSMDMSCVKCGPNCKTCTDTSPTLCSDCLFGAYLSGTTCMPCASECVTCSGSSTSCTQCKGGFYWNGSSCHACARNCKTCNAGGCTLCSQGFTINSGGRCIGCAPSCATCDASDITTCTSCGTNTGLEMVSGRCQSCTDNNCLSCSGSTCSLCKPGYHPDDDGECVLNCRLPCR